MPSPVAAVLHRNEPLPTPFVSDSDFTCSNYTFNNAITLFLHVQPHRPGSRLRHISSSAQPSIYYILRPSESPFSAGC